MTPEIRRAALRIAAKAALVATVGCGPADTIPIANTTPPIADAPSCPAYLGQLAQYTDREDYAKLAPDDPIVARLGKGLETYAIFADPHQRAAPRTQACCSEALGTSSTFRGACCSARDDGAPHDHGAYFGGVTDEEKMACSPWGPPCPPEMT